MQLAREEDAEVLCVLVHVQEDGARVFLVLTDRADGGCGVQPLGNDSVGVVSWGDVPDADRLREMDRGDVEQRMKLSRLLL